MVPRLSLPPRRLTYVTAVLVLLAGGGVWACQVPVFRYAIERWPCDSYRCVVLQAGPLADAEQALVERLTRSGSLAPDSVRTVDVLRTNEAPLKQLWDQRPQANSAVLAMFYPTNSATPPDQPAFVGSLDETTVEAVLSSPARQKLAHELSSGNSAVWIFVESGDANKDAAARQRLEEQLQLDAQWLKLPSPEEMEIKPQLLEQVKIKLKIDFAIISISANDPREKFLLDCLMNSESDLRDFAEPMAFPVFGRGRVLYALIGAGIAADTVRAADAFVAGPCSCQVKNQNPGFDLLLNFDWDQAVGPALISEQFPTPAPSSEPVLLKIPPGR